MEGRLDGGRGAFAEGSGGQLVVLLVHYDHTIPAALLGRVQRLIGELDEIIQQLEKEESLERRLAKMVLESSDGEELRKKIDGLGDRMLATKKRNPNKEDSRL